MTNSIYQESLRLRDAGLSLVPFAPSDGHGKRVAVKWEEYQYRLPTDAELSTWFDNDRRWSVGIVGGAVSGSVLCFDFETADSFARWIELVDDAEPGLVEHLVVVATPSGGRHAIMRAPGHPCPTKKLAWAADGELLIETRGERALFITPISHPLVHPTGRPYKLIDGDLADLPKITPPQCDTLLELAASLTERLPEPKKEHRIESSPAAGHRVGDDFNQRGSWEEIFTAAGWSLTWRGSQGLPRRPGTKKSSSAMISGEGSGSRLWVFTTQSAPFQSGRLYDKFGAWAAVHCGADLSAAARALAAMGFGKQRMMKQSQIVLRVAGDAAKAPPATMTTIGDESPPGIEMADVEPSAIQIAASQPAAIAIAAIQIDEDLPPADPDLVTDCFAEEEFGDARLLTHICGGRILFDNHQREWYTWAGNAFKVDQTQVLSRLVTGQVASQYLSLSAKLVKEAEAIAGSGGSAASVLPGSGSAGSAAFVSPASGSAASSPGLGFAASVSPGSGSHAATKKRELASGLIRRALQLRKLTRVKRVLELAQAQNGIIGCEWDSDPWLLGVQNGVVDLHTGEHRPGRVTDRIRVVAPTEYLGIDAEAPRWELFLSEILGGDTEVVAFLQRLLGYAITGVSVEHKLPILWGEQGRNGKDTLLRALEAVLGSYARAVSNDVIIKARKPQAGSARSDIIDLQGLRLGWASESDDESRLSAGTVKQLTGGGSISARQNFGRRQITFQPTHTLMLLTNRKPHAPADDEALWDRLVLIPFTVRFVDDPQAPNERKRDPDLSETLRAEGPGILAWLVRGCLEWQRRGSLDVPESLRLATREYREDEDLIEAFIRYQCEIGPNYHVKASAFYAAFRAWAVDDLGQVQFGKRMGQKFEKQRLRVGSKQAHYYRGVRLVEDNDDWLPMATDNAG